MAKQKKTLTKISASTAYGAMALEFVRQLAEEPEEQAKTASVDTYVDRSDGMDRGMFAERDFEPGEVIEIAPVLVVPRGQIGPKDVLRDYVFNFDEDNVMVALGYASMFNHSYSPNARYKKDKGSRTLTFTAIKPIKKGQEIFVNYNLDPNSKKPLWFDVKEKQTEKTAESDFRALTQISASSYPPKKSARIVKKVSPEGSSTRVYKNGKLVKMAGYLREALEELT